MIGQCQWRGLNVDYPMAVRWYNVRFGARSVDIVGITEKIALWGKLDEEIIGAFVIVR